MLKKLNELSTKAYVKGSTFLQSFKTDERGLSGVVVAVLLILVAVLAVVLLWDNLKTWLETMWGTISGKASQIQ